MSKPNIRILPEDKWGAFTVVGCAFAFAFLFVGMMAASFAPDPRAQRIEACMSQPGMKYTFAGECLPEDIPGVNDD